MYNDDKFFIGFVALMVIVMCTFLIAGAYKNREIFETTSSKLKADGFTVVTGEANSPTIMQTTTEYTEFTQIAHDINSTIVYRDGNRYIVIANTTYGCAFYP